MAVVAGSRMAAKRKEKAQRAEMQRSHEGALVGSSDSSDDEGGTPRTPGIKMNLKDLIDMGKADLGDLPAGEEAVPYNSDGTVRRWPTANENHTTVTEGQVHFLPAVAADFDEGTEMGEAARAKFTISIAAALGITPECVKITDCHDLSFLESVQELGRREEAEELVAGLDDKEEAEAELYELQMKHGKARFKAAVKKWRAREHGRGDIKLGRVRRRKEKLERLLDEMEREHNDGKPDESDFVPKRRHSIDNHTDPEHVMRDSNRKASTNGPGGAPASPDGGPQPASPVQPGGDDGGEEGGNVEGKKSAANPYGLSAELLKAKLEFDQKRRATTSLGKFSCRHQTRGGWLDESGLEPGMAVLTALSTRIVMVVMYCLVVAGLPHADTHTLSSAQYLRVGLRPVAWSEIENGTLGTTLNESCWNNCTAYGPMGAYGHPGGDGFWGVVHVLVRQSVVYILLVALASWHDLRLLRDPESTEATQLEIFRGLCDTDNQWKLPLGLGFATPGVGGTVPLGGNIAAAAFTILSALVMFLAGGDIAADASYTNANPAERFQLRFLPGVTAWEILAGRANCACSYKWVSGSGTMYTRWVLLHGLSVATAWQTVVIWWRIYSGYLTSTWLVSGNYGVKVVTAEAAGALVFDPAAMSLAGSAAGGDEEEEVVYFSGDFKQTIREGAEPQDGGWHFWERRSEMGAWVLLTVSAVLPILIRTTGFSDVPQ